MRQALVRASSKTAPATATQRDRGRFVSLFGDEI
jgi:hypothetical protein